MPSLLAYCISYKALPNSPWFITNNKSLDTELRMLLCSPFKIDFICQQNIICFLFLKMADEYSQPPHFRTILIPAQYNWQTLLNKSGHMSWKCSGSIVSSYPLGQLIIIRSSAKEINSSQ